MNVSSPPICAYLDVAAEVQDALAANRPVVALESTIVCHGMPWPQNAETALRVEACIREHGAVPATVAILDGRLKAGLNTDQIEMLARSGRSVAKCSRRDLPFLVSRGLHGATTVAATMIIARMAGIGVFATGGIGGVHRNAAVTLDVSADLQELAQTDVAVICAGAKSILDLGLTLEYLETHGVPVIGYGTNTLPAFYCRESDFRLDFRLDDPAQVAAFLIAKRGMKLAGGVVIANPIPAPFALPRALVEGCIHKALGESRERGITGKDVTPFLLRRIGELTGGDSLESNIELVLNNARLAARIAAQLAHGRQGP